MGLSSIEHFLNLLEEKHVWEGKTVLVRGQYLVNIGDKNTKLYLVKDGSLRALVYEGDQEHTLRLGYNGSVFGSLDSFLSGRPSHMAIQALKKSELAFVSKERLMHFIDSDRVYKSLYQELLTSVILQQIERELDLLVTSPEIRYQRVLARSPQLFQYIPHKYIADYLRMTPETLSRIQKS